MNEMQETMKAELAEAIRTLEKANGALARIFGIEQAASVGTCAQCNAWDDTLEEGICQTCIREGEGEDD
jgi:hypothetical protein